MLDFIGIGLGPFNLSLAALLNQHASLKYQFVDKRHEFDWHAGIQLPNAMMQVPFMADLVSLVEPTSPYSFLNYLKAHQRLYKFYFRENMYIPRQEYNHYCQWVVKQLRNLQFASRVTDIAPISGGFQVITEHKGRLSVQQTQKLVLGTGTIPKLPQPLQRVAEQTQQCIHSSNYIDQCKDHLSGNVVLIGSGQSAAEIFIDLFDKQIHPETGKSQFHLYWLTRSAGFFPMENTPLGLESFSPDYMSYFYHLPKKLKDTLPVTQANLYKGISAKTIRDIYERLYQRSIGDAEIHVTIAGHHQLENAEIINGKSVQLKFFQTQKQQVLNLQASMVIAATGYQYPSLDFLTKLSRDIPLDGQNHWEINEHHQLNYQGEGKIYIQNTDLRHHGVGTPDLGLGAFRSAKIANQILGESYFNIEGRQSFQDFHYQESDRPFAKSAISKTHARTDVMSSQISRKAADHYPEYLMK
ncbi:lysine N(6)-hydroxylase/L-ornithine N(5)-oxygenase family protein [Acinetobacter tibetensis]|uniref:SidA/IucD/PvdA family monooxygenase n=1 Tax=Acinetobacter tibetensis TaxID=2943497 RepID=A0AAE9LTN3_9GAMM|nr:SidA/IucD/PvdA family monooxygenase [Acinetobacter tibetensis]USE84429.1 SidA/IucD/PvdA family monooxygenase [Acinetobacter tibetensis]